MHAVDLGTIIDNASGDDAFVRTIVTMSIDQADAQIGKLANLCIDGPSDEWTHVAHALKGTAATLGAEDLRVLCETAQRDMHDVTAQVRQAHVHMIAEKYAAMRTALADIGYL